MYSGRVAAETAAAALKIGDVGAENLWRFDHDLWGKIGHELKVSAKLQKIAGLEWLLNFTIRRAAHSPEVRDTLCAMIAREVPREQMTSPLFYLKLWTM